MMLGHAVSGTRLAIKLEYAQPLNQLIVFNLRRGKEDIDHAIDVMVNYNISPEALKEHLGAAQYPHGTDPLEAVDTAVKGALTRTWNKRMTVAGIKEQGKRKPRNQRH